MKKKRKRSTRTTAKSKVQVDIVLPVYGQPEFLRACLESLYAHDAGIAHTVTLVDDKSPVDMAWVYEYAKDNGAKVIHHYKNGGFAATCNTGARAGRADWILLLNTDMLITHDGWLAAMVAEGKDKSVGIVGCLLTYFPENHLLYEESPLRPAEKVQFAGTAFDIIGRPFHVFAGWSSEHQRVNQRREMNAVTGACLLARRSLWRRLGGLDEDYTKGNFEDVQFCLQARVAGYKVIYTPQAHLRHYAGGSENSTTAKRNAQLFQLKMGEIVEYDEWKYW